tara:strand:+ start:1808 stop:2008 length:201 start_codon:yes stop_codon:yes gene_type:complete
MLKFRLGEQPQKNGARESKRRATSPMGGVVMDGTQNWQDAPSKKPKRPQNMPQNNPARMAVQGFDI